MNLKLYTHTIAFGFLNLIKHYIYSKVLFIELILFILSYCQRRVLTLNYIIVYIGIKIIELEINKNKKIEKTIYFKKIVIR